MDTRLKKLNPITPLRSGGFLNPLSFGLLITLGILLSGGLVARVTGQKPADLEVGVAYTCAQNNNYEFKVLSCDQQDWCQVFIANKFSPGGGSVTGQGKATTLSLIQKWGCHVQGRPVQANEVKDENQPQEKTQAVGPAQAPQASECPSDESLKARPKPGDSSELKSKRAILAGYQKEVDAKQYWAVGITFDSLQVGPPHANIRGVLYHEDAPLGTPIYPVKTKLTVCQRYDTELKRDLLDGHYECFKDNFGEWNCATATGHRTINTTYEKAPKWKMN